MGSSTSSCFGRFVRPFGLLFGGAGRVDGSFVLGAGSGAGESGDFEVLAESEWAERRTERRVSRGERGGPIVAVWAMSNRSSEQTNVYTYLGLAALTLLLPFSPFHSPPHTPSPSPRPPSTSPSHIRQPPPTSLSSRSVAAGQSLILDGGAVLACVVSASPQRTRRLAIHAERAGDKLSSLTILVGAGVVALRMRLSDCT